MAAARELARADLGETVHAVRCGTTFIYGCARSSFEWFSCMSMILVCRNSLSSRGPLARRAATRERRRPSHRHALTAPLAHRTPHTGRHSRHGQPTWTRPTATLRGIRSDRGFDARVRAGDREGPADARSPCRLCVALHTHTLGDRQRSEHRRQNRPRQRPSPRERETDTHTSHHSMLRITWLRARAPSPGSLGYLLVRTRLTNLQAFTTHTPTRTHADTHFSACLWPTRPGRPGGMPTGDCRGPRYASPSAGRDLQPAVMPARPHTPLAPRPSSSGASTGRTPASAGLLLLGEVDALPLEHMQQRLR